MKPSVHCRILCLALLAGSLSAALSADDQPAAAPRVAREESVLVTITASVEAINQTNREVTLKGALGNSVTFTVDDRVKRLNEVKVGDLVRAEYYISIAADLRKPTPEEEKVPFMMLDTAGKSPAGSTPTAGGLRRFKVVTTVEGLDRPTSTVTVKGPRGNYLTARVADPVNLTRMKIGDTIVVTYTEARAIALEKAESTVK